MKLQLRVSPAFSAVIVAAIVPLLGHPGVAAEPAAPAPERPNFLVILVDDMGYSDLGCYGGEIETPNIDQLAQHGLRFRQFYNCSRCCPTRASLLTGAYPQRIGQAEFGRTMDLDVPTLGQHLGAAGYETALSGKWHLSELPATRNEEQRIRWLNHQLDLGIPFVDPASMPTRRGFDRFYGILWGVVDHFDPFSLTAGEEPVRQVPDDYYSTDAITDYSLECLRDFAATDKPFFLYVAYTAPHWPIQAPPAAIARYRGRYDAGWNDLRQRRFARQVELGLFPADTPLGDVRGRAWSELSPDDQAYAAAKMEVHAAMVDRVDHGVGRILAELRATGQLDNTVVLFMSDNGASPEIPGEPGYDRHSATRDGRPALRERELRRPANRAKLGTDESYTGIGPGWASAVNTPLNYWKMESFEGGCRTPLIVHWPRGLRTAPGGFTDAVGHVIDVVPTFLELAGCGQVRPFPLDGVSLAAALRAEPAESDRSLLFAHMGGGGIRRGDWKASKALGDNSRWQLFDLARDPGETRDLAGDSPAALRELVAEWERWSADPHAVHDPTAAD